MTAPNKPEQSQVVPEGAVDKVVATAPERIWLQVADDVFHRDEPFPDPPTDCLTWCAEPCVACEVEYVRADLAAAPKPAAEGVKPDEAR